MEFVARKTVEYPATRKNSSHVHMFAFSCPLTLDPNAQGSIAQPLYVLSPELTEKAERSADESRKSWLAYLSDSDGENIALEVLIFSIFNLICKSRVPNSRVNDQAESCA